MKSNLIPIFAFLLLVTQQSMATDAGNGKVLVDKSCVSCHDDSVYTRQDRRVTTKKGLIKQVRRCEQSLGLKWFDEEIGDVVSYLNDNYYHFK